MKSIKFLVILLLVFAVAFTLVACNDDEGTPQVPGGSNEGNQPTLWDRDEVNDKITVGLRNAGTNIQNKTDGVRHVVSEYHLLVDIVNITFYYEANYNLNRAQDSEILLRVFNNQYEANELFVYYNNGTLYYEIDGQKSKITKFGNTSRFDTFYSAMQAFDAGSYYFSEDFAYYLTNGVPITRNISIIPIGNNKESILFTNVNLNVAVVPVIDEDGNATTVNIREYINGMIKDYVSLVGESFDALSDYLIGFELSTLKNVEIGVINLDKLNIINENNQTSDINIDISGKQADNIGIFRFGFRYANSDKASAIELKKTEDPNYMVEDLDAPGNQKPANNYKSTQPGQVHLAGEMYIPSLDIDKSHPFKIDIKADTSSSDNSQNLLYIDIRDRSSENLQGGGYYINKSIALICYENGTTYVDIEGLRDLYLGDGIALWQLLDVPGGAAKDNKLSFELTGLNLSQEVGMFTDFLMSLLINVDVDAGQDTLLSFMSYERLATMLSYISSDGSKIVFTLNNDLLAELIGDDSANLIGWIAQELGISETIIESVVGTGVLDDAQLKLFYDTKTGEIGVILYNGSTIIFELSLYSQDIPEAGIDIDFPAEYFTNNYYPIKEPEAVTLELNGTITKQGATPIDMSKLMGAFIGDVTGANTPHTMTISDIIGLNVKVWSIGDKTYVKALLSTGTKSMAPDDYTKLMDMYTVVTGTTTEGIREGEVFCNNHMLGIKYSMTLQALMQAFEDLLGEDNVFTVDGVMNVVNMLSAGASLSFNEDNISFRLAPYDKGGVSYDPVYELIGLPSLIADLSAKINFVNGVSFDTLQDVFGAEFDDADYPAPQIDQLPNVRFESIYQATWHDSVNVVFVGGVSKSFKLSFIGDSAKLVSNTYDYYPEAKLFGEVISYMLILTDTQNGTKVISELAIPKLSINPIEAQPIPKKIGVLYDDGSLGELAFEIVEFPYGEKTIATALQGLALRNYSIIIGKGSIAERRFILPIEILNRTIIPLQLTDADGKTYTHYGAVPIVAAVSIDPYDYLLKKEANPEYNAVDPKDAFYLYFEAIDPSLGDTRLNILADPQYANFGWGFEESAISFRGGTYYAVADYYSLQIAVQITVKARIFDYIKVFVKDPDHGLIEERDGHYTVDALLPDSYAMPSVTDSRAEVRIYFKTGNYRVMGSNLGVEVTDVCDGEFPHALNWSLEADNIDIDGTTVPLLGITNINKGVFAPENANVKRFQQNINIVVDCPSRRLELLADAIRSEINRDANNNSVMGDIKVNRIAFVYTQVPSQKQEDYGRYTYNPIDAAAQSRLPSYVYIPVQYGNALILRRYPVSWLESNLVDRYGNLRYPSADEVFVKAEGIIGTQTATIAIHNIKAPYQLDIPDPNQGGAIISKQENGMYVLEINPYDSYLLPPSITVRYTQTGVNQTFNDIVWYIYNSEDLLVSIGDDYKFPYQGGDYVIYTHIQKDATAGILAQTVPLIIRVESMMLNNNDAYNYIANDLDVGLGCQSESNGLRYVAIDTYAAPSLALLNMLVSGITELQLNFMDNSGELVTKDGLQVSWVQGSVEALINALKSPLGSSLMAGGNIELKGSIFKGTNIEQSITFVYKIAAQEFGSINFVNIDPYYTRTAQEITSSDILADVSRYDVLTLQVDPATKEIFILLKKPYALKGAARNYALPSEYFSFLLDNISLIITSASGSRQIPECSAVFDMEDSFDGALLNFVSGAPVTSANFLVKKLNAESSCEENFVIRVQAMYDVPIQKTLTTNVETLQAGGNAIKEYETSGYAVEQSVSVTYINSGTIKYTVDKWSINTIYRAYIIDDSNVVADDKNSLLSSEKSITMIPNALFHSITGNTITLVTTLPDGTDIYNEIRFLPKNINGTDYRAIADDPNYNIGYMGKGGFLEIRDAYSVYPFDPAKLPRVITPNQSSTFNIIDGNEISFTVAEWIPDENFADESGNFSIEKLKKHINSGGMGDTLFATAQIDTGYNVKICDENGKETETQTIKLYINVNQLYQYVLEHERLDIDIKDIAEQPIIDEGNYFETTRYSIVIDPYGLDALDRFAQGDNFFFRLPTRLTATMYSKAIGSITVGTITHVFQGADLEYFLLDNNGGMHRRDAISYSFNGHKLGEEFGERTSTITVRALLKDYMRVEEGTIGQYFEFGISFLDRTLDETMGVKLDNYTNKPNVDGKLTGKYYIDPYNQETFQLPDKAEFYFTEDSKELGILWTIPAGAPFVVSGNLARFDPSKSATFYSGGIYTFGSDLSQYGVHPQPYTVKIIVINRSLKEQYNEAFDFDSVTNTLEGMASDIPNTLEADQFVSLEGGEYLNYHEIATPVIPSIVWNVEDKEIDFINGFHDKVVQGSLYYGDVAGEGAQVTISGNKLRYVSIVSSIDENGVETSMDDSITIEFNSFTNSSADVAFIVNFQRIDKDGKAGEFFNIVCYSKPYATTNEQKRAVIDWGVVEDTDENAVRMFYICNLFKLDDAPNNRITVNSYKFSFGQMIIDEIDLGYGKNVSGLVEFVIDPIYPQIPDKITAYGKNTLTNRNVVIPDVEAVWADEIYNHTSLAGGQYQISLNLLINKKQVAVFEVIVYYLNRVAQNIYTTDANFSTVAASDNDYRLLITDPLTGIRTSYFEIDPIKDSIYDAAQKRYKLPTNLKVTYNYNFASGSVLQKAIEKLGAETFYDNLGYSNWLMSEDIRLSGTADGDFITLKLSHYTFKYEISGAVSETISVDISAANNNLDETYDLLFTVIDRSVAHTSISSEFINEEGNAYQMANSSNEIDPYNPVFPKEISVFFAGREDPKIYGEGTFEWLYDEDYFEDEDVLSGNDPAKLFMWATIKVYGADLNIKFKIKPRYIEVPRYPNGGIIGIDGGTLYVLMGANISTALPNHMYYKFDNEGVTEVAKVPLSFPTSELAKIDTSRAGVYYNGIKAKLGKIDDNNIKFNIVIVNPVIYNIITSTSEGGGVSYDSGKFIYDLISVPCDQLGDYNAGQEYLLMPRVVIVETNGGYLEIDYTSTVYDIDTEIATFYCKYYFRSSSDRLSGNANGYDEDSAKMTFVFTKKISPYNYHNVSEELYFRNAQGEPDQNYIMTVTLGRDVNSSQMPKAYDSRGTAYNLFWDFSKVNVNKAGNYSAIGYYRNQLESNVAMGITVRVAKQKLSEGDITIDNFWLERRYSGAQLPLTDYLTVADFLREDGTYGPVNYTIGYAFSQSGPWISSQPIDVGTYYVRILIEDYNVDDYRVFSFRIRVNEIIEDEIFYMDNSPGANTTLTYDDKGKITARNITYTYNGLEQRPWLVYTGGGVDIIERSLLLYAETCYKYNEDNGVWELYTGVIKNVGIYKLVMSINAQTNFYYSPDNMPIEVTIRIQRKTVYYSLVDSFVYSGDYVNVPIIIRDAYAQILDSAQYSDLYDIVAASVYQYEQRVMGGWLTLPAGSKVISAGTYRVTVRINAGINYNSANLLLPSGTPDTTTIVDELRDKQFMITKKQVDVRINNIWSYYLDDILPFYSSITLNEPGAFGDQTAVVKSNLDDIIAILGALDIVIGVGGIASNTTLTKYSIKGLYPLTLVSRPSSEAIANYEIMHFYDGIYEIATPSEAVLITSREQLMDNISTLEDNSETPYKWYLSAGAYGSIEIDKNVNLSIVGAFDESGTPAVVFDSIKITEGTVGLDIVRLRAIGNTSVVYLGANAGALTVSRSRFVRTGVSYLTNSVAIYSEMGYQNTLYANDTYIYGFTSGILLMGGSINMHNCTLDNNISALQVRKGDLELHDSTFSYNKSDAVYIAGTGVAFNFNNNAFIANVVAIKTTVAISNEVYNKNSFVNNARDIKKL